MDQKKKPAPENEAPVFLDSKIMLGKNKKAESFDSVLPFC